MELHPRRSLGSQSRSSAQSVPHMKHFLSIESQTAEQLTALLESSIQLRQIGAKHRNRSSLGKPGPCFSASRRPGRGSVLKLGFVNWEEASFFFRKGDIQLGRGEPIIDTARVLGRMVHGAVIRTFAQSDVEQFAEYSQIPTINALTDDEHPCQILADLLTILEKRGSLDDLKVCFIGDGREQCRAFMDLGGRTAWIRASNCGSGELSPCGFSCCRS